MKTNALILMTLITMNFGLAQSNTGTITVTVENIKNNEGIVSLALHDGTTFMKSQPVMSESSKVDDGKAIITFKNVPYGEYAIIALHDENENQRMDFDANGMPKEDYGCSNNPMFFGPPQYDESAFQLDKAEKNLSIRF